MATTDDDNWGKINKGQRFACTAEDLDYAISRLNLGKYEQIIMYEVRDKSWGLAARKGKKFAEGEPVPAVLRIRELARQEDADHSKLFRAINSLVASRILIRSEDGILINKQVPEWVFPGTDNPRLTPKQIEIARSRQTAKRKSNQETCGASESTVVNSAGAPQGTTLVLSATPIGAPQGTTLSAPPKPP